MGDPTFVFTGIILLLVPVVALGPQWYRSHKARQGFRTRLDELLLDIQQVELTSQEPKKRLAAICRDNPDNEHLQRFAQHGDFIYGILCDAYREHARAIRALRWPIYSIGLIEIGINSIPRYLDIATKSIGLAHEVYMLFVLTRDFGDEGLGMFRRHVKRANHET